MENTSNKGWNEIPNVVLDQIFTYLPWSDKINASATCKNWRCALYHPCFKQPITFSLTPLNKEKEEKAKYFMHAFGKIVRFVDIIFDSLDPMSTLLTDEVLNILADNKNLKKLRLKPSHCALYQSGNPSFNTFYLNSSRMYNYLLTILARADELEELSIGCLDDVAMYSNKILKQIVHHHSKSLRVLGIATLKYDPEENVRDSLHYHYLKNFSNLQVLSVNYDYVNDDFLQVLIDCSLRRMIIHVHSNVQDHPGTSDSKWAELTKYCPGLELRLNVLHAYSSVLDMHRSLLRKSMPLTHLRVLFCETLNSEALNSLYLFGNSLRSLWWVDSPRYSNFNVLVKDEFNNNSMNPLIFAAWRCTNLEEIVLIGYKYFVDDLRAISRLRGNILKRLDVLQCEMIDSFEYREPLFTPARSIEEEVSNGMGKPWRMLKKRDVHPVIFYPDKYDSDEYLLPILYNDLEL